MRRPPEPPPFDDDALDDDGAAELLGDDLDEDDGNLDDETIDLDLAQDEPEIPDEPPDPNRRAERRRDAVGRDARQHARPESHRRHQQGGDDREPDGDPSPAHGARLAGVPRGVNRVAAVPRLR